MHNVLTSLAEGTTSPKMILKNLDSLLTSRRGPILSTIHKAKGTEAKNVIIVNFDKMPSRFAKLDWMQVQEQNLIYVAITRAKLNLTFHMSGDE